MTFDQVALLWATQGVFGLRDAFEGPLLLPLEPWAGPASARMTLTLGGPPAAQAADFDGEMPTMSAVKTLSVVHSSVGDRVPANRVPVLVAAKTGRNAYLHVAVGRSTQNDVVIEQASVSRFHADIRWSEGGYSVRDARSRNGTRLNAVALEPQRNVPLKAGDVVAFGDAGCLFCPLEEEALASVLSRFSTRRSG